MRFDMWQLLPHRAQVLPPCLALLGLEDSLAIVTLIVFLASSGGMPETQSLALHLVLVAAHIGRATSLISLLLKPQPGSLPTIVLPGTSLGMLLARMTYLSDFEPMAASLYLGSCTLAMACSMALSNQPAVASRQEIVDSMELLNRWTLRTFNAEERDGSGSEATQRSEVTCVVCLAEMSGEERLVELTCWHVYHELCVKQWFLKGGQGCPLRCPAPDDDAEKGGKAAPGP